VIGQFVCEVLDVGVDLVVGLGDLEGLLIDLVCIASTVRILQVPASCCGNVQMVAWGSLARDVPKRNLRSFSLVSSEKVNSLDSEACTQYALDE
jgi:hypothetical protein